MCLLEPPLKAITFDTECVIVKNVIQNHYFIIKCNQNFRKSFLLVTSGVIYGVQNESSSLMSKVSHEHFNKHYYSDYIACAYQSVANRLSAIIKWSSTKWATKWKYVSSGHYQMCDSQAGLSNVHPPRGDAMRQMNIRRSCQFTLNISFWVSPENQLIWTITNSNYCKWTVYKISIYQIRQKDLQ